MNSKPTVTLLVLGEPRYRWYQSLAPQDLYSFETQEHEGDARKYRLLFRMGSPERFHGVLLLLSFHEVLSEDLRASLLLASRYTQELSVILCDMHGKSDEERDEEEECLREELAELGFKADNALFFDEPTKLPTKETMTTLYSALDTQDALLSPASAPTPLPEGPDKILAEFLSLAKELVLPATLLTLVKSNADKLYELPISTQLGGMPYLEQGEEWPQCNRCRAALRFMFQLDAAQDLRPAIQGAGLFTIYYCGAPVHERGEPVILTRHYASPDPQKRQSIRAEATKTKKPISPCTVNRAVQLQFPSFHSSESLPEEHNGTTQDMFFRRLSLFAGREPNLLDYEGVYHNTASEMGASPAEFAFGEEQPLQIGGYSDTGDGPTPSCKKCNRVMRTLAHIHEVKGLGYPFQKRTALQLFLCSCTPTLVRSTIRSESESERYDRLYE